MRSSAIVLYEPLWQFLYSSFVFLIQHCWPGCCTYVYSTEKSSDQLTQNPYHAMYHCGCALLQTVVLCIVIIIFTDGSSLALLNFTLTRKSNITFALCSVNNVVDLNCSVQYSQDLYYTNFSPPITGPINSPFPISLPDSSKDLYYQASIMLNSSLKVIVRTRSPFSKEIHHGVTAPALITIGLLGSATAALFLALLVCLCLLLLLFIKGK